MDGIPSQGPRPHGAGRGQVRPRSCRVPSMPPAEPDPTATTPARPGQDTAPPDASPCWRGDWLRVAPAEEVWAQAALNRSVSTLPRLHPWRLGDAKGSWRLLQWFAGTTSAPAPECGGLAVLAVTAAEPRLDAGDGPGPSAGPRARWQDVLLDRPAALGGGPIGALGSWAMDTVSAPPVRRWAGALVRLPGTWLPPIAWLPRELRGIDDPGTRWPTESEDFRRRWTLHAEDLRVAADLLTPAVMAAALDLVPATAAVTVAGDTLHVWWPYRDDALRDVGRVARAVTAAGQLAAGLPSFVLADHPDLGDQVEQTIEARREEAAAYRAGRRPGHSDDPVLQRMYDQARAARER
jgi:hypothetical protein